MVDPTITLNGQKAWHRGRLALVDSAEVQAILKRYSGAHAIFALPAMEIGV